MKRKFISELTNVLKQKFNHDLLAVVLFGSTVKGTSTTTSDIDVLVVCEAPQKDWRARDKMILELTEEIELKYAAPIHMALVSKDEISQAIESVYLLMLEICEANEIIYDKNNFFKHSLQDFEKNIHCWHAKKSKKGSGKFRV
ncbi:MAG: nucleotidyltransferase domain-containing protein [Nitrospirota bacterium]|nr:nucleotidyltransferase domain-containing protein [Nitrospirota bacterium]